MELQPIRVYVTTDDPKAVRSELKATRRALKGARRQLAKALDREHDQRVTADSYAELYAESVAENVRLAHRVDAAEGLVAHLLGRPA